MTTMNAFHRGDKALLTDTGTSHTVTIVEVVDKSANSEYAILTAGGDQWFARENQLTPPPEATDAFAAGDRVAFADRRPPHGLPLITGTVLFVSRDEAMVQYDILPGWPTGTNGIIAVARLARLTESPEHHAAALLRAADWFRHHPTGYRPETVTTAVDPAADYALAELADVLRTPPHVLHDELDARYGTGSCCAASGGESR